MKHLTKLLAATLLALGLNQAIWADEALDFQWINDSEFVIHSKYKGILVNSWQIGLAG